MASDPSRNNSQNLSGLSACPGKRQAMPITAIGSDRVRSRPSSLVRSSLTAYSACWRGVSSLRLSPRLVMRCSLDENGEFASNFRRRFRLRKLFDLFEDASRAHIVLLRMRLGLRFPVGDRQLLRKMLCQSIQRRVIEQCRGSQGSFQLAVHLQAVAKFDGHEGVHAHVEEAEARIDALRGIEAED